MLCATVKQTKSDADREPNMFQTFCLEKKCSPSHYSEYRDINSIHWGVVCIAARADVYAMMMCSLTDDHIRQPRSYHQANFQSVLKNISSNIISCPIPRHCCFGVK